MTMNRLMFLHSFIKKINLPNIYLSPPSTDRVKKKKMVITSTHSIVNKIHVHNKVIKYKFINLTMYRQIYQFNNVYFNFPRHFNSSFKTTCKNTDMADMDMADMVIFLFIRQTVWHVQHSAVYVACSGASMLHRNLHINYAFQIRIQY